LSIRVDVRSRSALPVAARSVTSSGCTVLLPA
jgi:hypothetical protein